MSRDERKRREVEIGLANNAFGAAAGTVATVQARNAWKRSASAGTLPNTRIGRLIGRSKISPGKAIMAAGALNVAGQATNGLLDAQSAHYFARERMNMPKQKKVAKGFFRDVKGGYLASSRVRRAGGTPEQSMRAAVTVRGRGIARLEAAERKLAKKPVRKAEEVTVTKFEDAGNGSGRRITEPVDKGLRDRVGEAWGEQKRDAVRTVTRQAGAANELRTTGKIKDVPGYMGESFKRSQSYNYRTLRRVGRLVKVGKARRFDPEADRQRRLGAYSGLAAGGALVVGDRAAREVGRTHVKGTIVDRKTGLPKSVQTSHIGFKPGRGKVGAALAGATVGLGALAAGTYKRGISERNKPWT